MLHFHEHYWSSSLFLRRQLLFLRMHRETKFHGRAKRLLCFWCYSTIICMVHNCNTRGQFKKSFCWGLQDRFSVIKTKIISYLFFCSLNAALKLFLFMFTGRVYLSQIPTLLSLLTEALRTEHKDSLTRENVLVALQKLSLRYIWRVSFKPCLCSFCDCLHNQQSISFLICLLKLC